MKTNKLIQHYQFLSELTNEELAERLGVQTFTLYRWKKGLRTPSGTVDILVRKLLNELGG